MEKIKNVIEKFPRKLMRRLFWIFAVCWLSFAVFSPSICYAVDSNEQSALQEQESFNKEVRSVINMLSQIVYIFLWPLLVIAWTALDNTLVYGKFLNLDAALWDVWNIMKNIANFSLWFVFIFAIVKNLFKSSFWEGNPLQDAVKVVKGTLISWVLVQMSWFILGVLLDLSTILIYAVWGLPLSMLWAYNADLASVPIMELHTNLSENGNWSFSYYYSYWSYNFSPCFIIDNESSNADVKMEWYNGKYIAWRRYLYLSWEQTFDSGYCVLYGYPYKYQESPDFMCDWWSPCYQKSWDTLAAMNASYYDQLKTFVSNLGTWGTAEQKGKCFIIGAYGTWCELSSDTWTHYWAMSFTWDIFSSAQWKLDSLLESSKSWVWPLITMYSSILKVQELLVNPGDTSTISSLFGAIINTFFVVILFIPIAILAVLLIIRIWLLWVTIALSPILVLIKFGPDPINKLKDNDIFKKFSVEETLKRIFSPIVVVFAVSLSIIFLTTIHASRWDEDNKLFLESLWIQQHDCEWNWPVSGGEWWGEWENSSNSPENCRYTVSWLVDLKIDLSGFNHWKDVFVWCLMMMLSTWIVRFFMKFAINVMWKWNIWEKLMKSSEDFLKSVPIVPLPGGWAIGISKVGEVWIAKRLDVIRSAMDSESEKKLQERFPWAYWITENKEDTATRQVDAILDEVRTWNKTYQQLSGEQRETINNYYWNAEVAEQVVQSIVDYRSDEHKADVTKIQEQAQHIQKQSSDALNLTKDQLNMAVKNEDAWINWAGWMIWWAVHTSQWVFIVDVIPWTETHPVYEILSREDYEKRHFGNNEKTIENIDKETYDQNQEAINSYLKNLASELGKLKDLQEGQQNWTLSQQEKDLLKWLENLDQDLRWKAYSEEIKETLGINN